MDDYRKLVLTVDDDTDTRTFLKIVLEENNYRVVEASDGKTGLDLFKKLNPDLVLLDLRMPGMTGLEVLNAITQITRQTPVIVVSATDSIDDVVESLRLGAWDFILKPMSTYNILKHRVEKVFERALLKKQNREYQELLEEAVGKLQNDLTSGQAIQQKLLPTSPQKLNGCTFKSMVLPSRYLSGDFVDYFFVDENHAVFYFADVSGHGVPSALVTVFLKSFMSKSLLDFQQGINTDILNPQVLIRVLNQAFINEKLDKFITLFFGVINHAEQSLTYCNNGHYPYPFFTTNGKTESLASKNTPVGIVPEIEFETQNIKLLKDFRLIFFSDGVLDILPQENLDKKINFLKGLCEERDDSLNEFIEGLKENASGLPDDITILTIEGDASNER